MTVENLIDYAYGVESFQVTGPDWTSSASFDIEATIPQGANKEDDRRMLQALLKDRFKLGFHIEKKELEGYALVVGKHGEKLTPSLPDSAKLQIEATLKPGDGNAGEGQPMSKVTKNADGSSTVDMGERGTQTVKYDPESWAMHYERSKMTMEELARGLRSCLESGDHKIADQTGIKGTYQVGYDCPLKAPRPTKDSGATGTLPSDPGGSRLPGRLMRLG